MGKKRKAMVAILCAMAAASCVGCNLNGGVEPTQTEVAEMPETQEPTEEVEDTEFAPKEYELPEDLDTSDVDYPVPTGDFVPSRSGEYGKEENFWLYDWPLDNIPMIIKEEWNEATLHLEEDSISVHIGGNNPSDNLYENVTYEKTRGFNKEELEWFSYCGGPLPLDCYYADNSPCTMYDVRTEEGKVMYKIIVFSDKIWLLNTNDGGFGDMDDILWVMDDLMTMIEFVQK